MSLSQSLSVNDVTFPIELLSVNDVTFPIESLSVNDAAFPIESLSVNDALCVVWRNVIILAGTVTDRIGYIPILRIKVTFLTVAASLGMNRPLERVSLADDFFPQLFPRKM